jgi:Domain of unknown function (DUF6379)
MKVRIAYYRGMFLSTIEDYAIKVNGEAIPREDIRVSEESRNRQTELPIVDDSVPVRRGSTQRVSSISASTGIAPRFTTAAATDAHM